MTSVSGNIYEIDPSTWTSSVLVQGPPWESAIPLNYDGIALSTDGRTIYAASEGNSTLVGYDTSTGANVFYVTSGINTAGVDGVAFGEGSLDGKLYVNCNDGTLFEIDLATQVATALFTDGTRGDFVEVAEDGSLLVTQAAAILRLTPPLGGSFGPISGIICTRDDTNSTYSPLGLGNMIVSTTSAQLAGFDLTGITGNVRSAWFTRVDAVTCTNGEAIDFQIGIAPLAGILSNNPCFATPTHFSATAPPGSSASISNAWPLPSVYLADLQGNLGNEYDFHLVDQASIGCAAFGISDQSQPGWPETKNSLTFLITSANNPQIPDADCLDISVPGTNAPANGTWEIVLNNSIVASSGNPNGWNVEPDHNSHYQGAIICVPATAAIAVNYQVHLAGLPAESGVFDVVPNSGAQHAPTLLPIALSTNSATPGGSVSANFALDFPAPSGGATIVLTTDNGSVSLPGSVVVPAGSNNASVTVTVSGLATAPGSGDIFASYNGLREATLAIKATNGSAPSQPTGLTSVGGANVVTNTWNSVSNALTYNIKRSRNSGGPYVTIFSGLTPTNFLDETVVNGLTYYYVVSAQNLYGEGLNSTEASATPSAGTVATPLISGITNTFPPSVSVSLSDPTSGAFIYYTLDGSDPTQGSILYSNSFALYTTTKVSAKAFATGYTPSGIQQSNFILVATNYNTIDCGQVLAYYYDDYGDVALGTYDYEPNVDYSWIRGQGFYAQHYQFAIPPNSNSTTINITMSSSNLNSFLYLMDSNYNTLATNDDDYSGTPNSRIIYTFPAGTTTNTYLHRGDQRFSRPDGTFCDFS